MSVIPEVLIFLKTPLLPLTLLCVVSLLSGAFAGCQLCACHDCLCSAKANEGIEGTTVLFEHLLYTRHRTEA